MTRIGEPPAVVERGEDVPALVIARFTSLDLQVRPSIDAGRRRGHYVVLVTNPSSATVQARLSVVSPDGALRGLIAPAVMELAPGAQRGAGVELRARRPRLLGREREHMATVQARGHASAQVVRREIVFVQRRAVPFLALSLALAAVAAAIFGLTLLPDRVAVPRVEGAADIAAAQDALARAGLTVDPHVRSRAVTAVRPGTILDQIPAAGERASRGDRVTLLVAVGAGRVVMPSVEGMAVDRAVALVRAAGLSAGAVLPAGSPGNAVVASQLPVAGRRVAGGTVATLFAGRGRVSATAPAVGAPAAAGTTAGPGTDPAAPLAGGGGGGNGGASVPALDGLAAAEYAQAVAAAGLTPKVIRAVSPARPGSVIAVRPAAGASVAAGATVRIVVAAGVPRLAFDTGSVMRLFDPGRGRTVREAQPPEGSAAEPSWTADGRRVLYRVGRRLLLASATSASGGRVVYAGRTRFAAAAIAPTLTTGAVAMVRRSGADGDLCFARLGGGDLQPRCARDPKWDLGRAISWRPDGLELLVFGVRRGKAGTFGILRYRSARAFSTDPRDWRGTIATDTSQKGRGVIAAAYSPSGRNVGLITNVGIERFQVLITPASQVRDPSARPLPVRACELAWRPDGYEIAVVQSDDACSRPDGELVRVELKRPRETITVAAGGRHPAYQPLTYAGPEGLR
jgi:beta-lactam-binding protein with PASTA domain